MFFKSGCFSSCFSLVLFFLLSGSAADAKTETQFFSIPQADAAPSSTHIPFQLNETGVINVKISLASADSRTEKMVFASLHQKGNPYTLLSRYYKPGQSGVYLRYEVTRDALAAGGDYYLSIINYSVEAPLAGEVSLNYPVAGETEEIVTADKLPNLAVLDISLDEKCKVKVSLKNIGPGQLPLFFWKRTMPELTLSRDGVAWGAADIRFFDYGKALSAVGGECIYVSGLKVIGSARIMAVVDSNNVVAEQDEADNAKAVELVCK